MLFDDPPVPGFALRKALIGEADEERLLRHIAAEPLTPFQFGSFEGKRLTRSYGLHFDFTLGRLAPTRPIPDWLLPLRARCADFAQLPEDDLVQALVIRYDPGAGIGWHRDRPQFDRVVGVSLGSAATLGFRRRRGPRRFDRASVSLPPRGAYLLAGPARDEWEHGIPPHTRLRFSVTFRSLRTTHQNGPDSALGT